MAGAPGPVSSALALGTQVTTTTLLCYRVFDGKSAHLGRWLTPTKPTSQRQARSDLALPTNNLANQFCEVWIPVGTQIRVGVVAPLGGQTGGGIEVELLHGIPAACFQPHQPLPP